MWNRLSPWTCLAPIAATRLELSTPTGRALERDEKAIAEWKRKRWPEIKKKPKNKGS